MRCTKPPPNRGGFCLGIHAGLKISCASCDGISIQAFAMDVTKFETIDYVLIALAFAAAASTILNGLNGNF